MRITDKLEGHEHVIAKWIGLDGKTYYVIGDDDSTGEEVFTKAFGVDDSELIISNIKIIDGVVTANVKTGKLPSNCPPGFQARFQDIKPSSEMEYTRKFRFSQRKK